MIKLIDKDSHQRLASESVEKKVKGEGLYSSPSSKHEEVINKVQVPVQKIKEKDKKREKEREIPNYESRTPKQMIKREVSNQYYGQGQKQKEVTGNDKQRLVVEEQQQPWQYESDENKKNDKNK